MCTKYLLTNSEMKDQLKWIWRTHCFWKFQRNSWLFLWFIHLQLVYIEKTKGWNHWWYQVFAQITPTNIMFSWTHSDRRFCILCLENNLEKFYFIYMWYNYIIKTNFKVARIKILAKAKTNLLFFLIMHSHCTVAYKNNDWE